MRTSLLLLSFAAAALAGNVPGSFTVEVTGSGKPMILIPGLASPGSVWNSTVERFRDRYQCHVLTLSGFAGAPPSADASLKTVRRELAEYILDRGLKQPVIVGHSLGGVLALWLASEEPTLAGPLVIVDALPFLPAATDPTATPESVKPVLEMMRRNADPKSEFQERSIRGMVSGEERQKQVLEWSRISHQETVLTRMTDLFLKDLRPQVAKIKSRTLVLGTWIAYQPWATREQVEANFRRQFDSLPGVRLVLTDTARHFIMLDDPAWLSTQMESFLAAK